MYIKKCILLLILVVILCDLLKSQISINMSNDELTDKYWNYRKRIQAFIHYGTELV
jgi:hypothetical protein